MNDLVLNKTTRISYDTIDALCQSLEELRGAPVGVCDLLEFVPELSRERLRVPPSVSARRPKLAAFDAAGFCRAVDDARHARGRQWKDVAAEAGVSASTLTRMGQGKRPDVDSMAALAVWAGLSVDAFVRRRAARAGARERRG